MIFSTRADFEKAVADALREMHGGENRPYVIVQLKNDSDETDNFLQFCDDKQGFLLFDLPVLQFNDVTTFREDADLFFGLRGVTATMTALSDYENGPTTALMETFQVILDTPESGASLAYSVFECVFKARMTSSDFVITKGTTHE